MAEKFQRQRYSSCRQPPDLRLIAGEGRIDIQCLTHMFTQMQLNGKGKENVGYAFLKSKCTFSSS
jgi:hypothetical protein